MSSIDLGTCVRFSTLDGTPVTLDGEEGVVIEVVPPGEKPRTRRVWPRRLSRKRERFVVQWDDGRVLRRAAEMVVVAL
jgi:hypothetical protein